MCDIPPLLLGITSPLTHPLNWVGFIGGLALLTYALIARYRPAIRAATSGGKKGALIALQIGAFVAIYVYAALTLLFLQPAHAVGRNWLETTITALNSHYCSQGTIDQAITTYLHSASMLDALDTVGFGLAFAALICLALTEIVMRGNQRQA